MPSIFLLIEDAAAGAGGAGFAAQLDAAADVEIPPLTILPDVATPLTDITRASAGREESGGGGSEHCSQLKKGSAQ